MEDKSTGEVTIDYLDSIFLSAWSRNKIDKFSSERPQPAMGRLSELRCLAPQFTQLLNASA